LIFCSRITIFWLALEISCTISKLFVQGKKKENSTSEFRYQQDNLKHHRISISIYISYKAKPHYKFYLNMQDIHIISHYLFTSPPTNSHVIPQIFDLLIQAVHTISTKHNLISTYKKYRGIHRLLFVLPFQSLIIRSNSISFFIGFFPYLL
jgi:hypothetical protein